MRSFLMLLPLLLLFAVPSFAQNGSTAPVESVNETISLSVGESRHLTFPELQRLALGDPSVADVKSLGNDVVELSGLSRGGTTLIVWRTGQSRYTLRVLVR